MSCQPEHMVTVKTEPTVEPITLAELKNHLRLNSAAFSDNYDSDQSIAPGSHAIAASYTLVGSAVSVLGYDTIVELVSGTNGDTGTVNIKIQESDDNSTWTDWATGAFTQVTTANDNATYTKAYTGNKQYIRTVGTVALAACDFGTNIIRYAISSDEDAELTIIIAAVRKNREDLLGRKLITQTLQIYFSAFPEGNALELPQCAPLQSITSLTYTDYADSATVATLTDYYTDTISQPGRVVLKYSGSWPTTTLRTYWPIVVECVAGYGLAASVPEPIKLNILCHCADAYENREKTVITANTKVSINELPFVDNHIEQYRIIRY
jgi:uncharacterized phiE125 gp8 family phage protein